MTEITLFRQKRFDGGIRTGIEINQDTMFQTYQAGDEDHNPALLWYIDIRSRGEDIPADPDKARDWFRKHRVFFRDQLLEIAENLSVGFDIESLPFKKELKYPDAGVSGEVVVSSIHRLTARDMAEEIRKFHNEWDELLDQLERLSLV